MSLYHYKEVEQPSEDQVFTGYSSSNNKYTNPKVGIVIDNGSYQCRAGFSCDEKPRLIFRSLVGKISAKSTPIVGNSLNQSDNKLAIRSPFDSNILVHPPSQEAIFDYIFTKLGIDRAIENPLIITEPTSNPSYCRKYTSELAFECYNVPSVAYGIDSLFSFYRHRDQFKNQGENALIIGSGHSTTHIYNVQNHQVQHFSTKRINVGGGTKTDYMKKLLSLKYPKHKSFFTQNYINQIKENHCYFSKESYIEELKEFSDPIKSQSKTDIIQLPFQEIDFVKLEEDRQRKLEHRKKLGQKLKEKAEQKRKDKKSELEDQLQSLETIMQLKIAGLNNDFEQTMKVEGISNEKELQRQIEELRLTISGKKKEVIEKTDQEEYPLLMIPDSELNQDQLTEKKKQKVQKSMKDGKILAKRKRDEEKEKEEASNRIEEDLYLKDPEQYIKDLLDRRRKVLEKRDNRLKNKIKVVRRDQGLRTLTTKVDDQDQEQEEERENTQISYLEKLLNKFEPGWNTNIFGDDLDQSMMGVDEYYTAEDYQVKLGVERIKVPEILYEPKAIIGLDQMGLMETITSILNQIPQRDIRSMISHNIFLTGGNSNLKYFQDRIIYELTQINEPNTKINVVKDSLNSSLDAWLGAKKWSIDNLNNDWNKVSISKNEYQEYGHDYLKSHFASNLSVSSYK